MDIVGTISSKISILVSGYPSKGLKLKKVTEAQKF